MNPRSALRKNIIGILDAHLGRGYLLFVFGSFARNAADRSSDIDLAVWREEKIQPSAMAEIKEELEGVATLRDIDLVNLTDAAVNPRLLANILKEGVLWKKVRNSGELLKSLKRRLKNTARL